MIRRHSSTAPLTHIQTSHREGSGYSCSRPCRAERRPGNKHSAHAAHCRRCGIAHAGWRSLARAAIVEWSSRDRARLRFAARARFDSALGFDTIGRELCAAYETLAAERHHTDWKTRRSVAAGQDDKTARYYDSIATVYDSQVDAVESNRRARSAFLARVSSVVRPGGRIVDFGCGTGVDTLWYASHGHPVVAYDVSTGMTEMVRERCAEHVATGCVTVVAGPAQHCSTSSSDRVPLTRSSRQPHCRPRRPFIPWPLILSGGIVATQMLNPFYYRCRTALVVAIRREVSWLWCGRVQRSRHNHLSTFLSVVRRRRRFHRRGSTRTASQFSFYIQATVMRRILRLIRTGAAWRTGQSYSRTPRSACECISAAATMPRWTLPTHTSRSRFVPRDRHRV
jgi:hypothetical protein